MGFLEGTSKHPEWRELLEKTQDLKPGTMISHKDIAKIIGLRYGAPRYYQTVTAWKRHMFKDCDLLVVSIQKDGYRIVVPNEWTATSRRELVRGGRRIKHAARIAEHAPIDEMDTNQAQRHTNHLTWVSTLGAFYRKAERGTRAKMLDKPLKIDLPRLRA